MNFWTLLLKLATNYLKSYFSIANILGINPNILKKWLIDEPKKLQKAFRSLSTPRKIQLDRVLKGLVDQRIIDASDLIWQVKNGQSEKAIKTVEDVIIKKVSNAPVIREFKKIINKTDKLITEAKTDVELDEAQEVEMRSLSSSWIVTGHWVPNPDNETGSLTITTITGGTYTYYQVPIMTWVKMKLARGKNGTGAGSAFWKGYLHRYESRIKSLQLKKIKQQALAFKKKGIKDVSPDILGDRFRRKVVNTVRRERRVFA